jgi:hypothetical protein
MMTQGLKLASEQAERFFNLMAVKEAKQELEIQKNFLNINYRFLTLLPEILCFYKENNGNAMLNHNSSTMK